MTIFPRSVDPQLGGDPLNLRIKTNCAGQRASVAAQSSKPAGKTPPKRELLLLTGLLLITKRAYGFVAGEAFGGVGLVGDAAGARYAGPVALGAFSAVFVRPSSTRVDNSSQPAIRRAAKPKTRAVIPGPRLSWYRSM